MWRVVRCLLMRLIGLSEKRFKNSFDHCFKKDRNPIFVVQLLLEGDDNAYCLKVTCSLRDCVEVYITANFNQNATSG